LARTGAAADKIVAAEYTAREEQNQLTSRKMDKKLC
jgi:hypothetical protein